MLLKYQSTISELATLFKGHRKDAQNWENVQSFYD